VAYRSVRQELSVLGKLVIRGTRLVIPKILQKKVLNLAHEGHQGIVKTKQRLRKPMRIIPELVPFDKCDEEVRDRDAVLKQKGKEYADDKKNAKYPDLKVNDKVLLQQHKTCKTTTMYEHDPYEIVDVNGSQVTIKSGEGVCYKRNSSHVRKFEESDLPSGNEHID
ncbi:Hypothetical predicted protein, partial [Paramuricea clavata]